MEKAFSHKKTVFKRLTSLFLCILMIMSVAATGLSAIAATSSRSSGARAAAEPRLDLNFNKNWKFNLGDEGGAQAKAFDDSAWETVQLPHDFSISQDFTNSGTEVESGNLPGGTGWYRKMFTLPVEFAGKEFILNFDGAYNNAYVYVNGQLVCENHYGYNSFSANISDYLVCNGSTWNVVAVKVVSEMASSRWYPGAGLYRDVTMTILNPVHVSLYGTKVTTTGNTTMDAVVTVQNESTSSSAVTLKNDILDADENIVATSSQDVTVPAVSSTDANVSMTVASPNLWDIETPYLYTLRTTITDASGNVLDVYDTEFGFRTINWDATTGFSLNGSPVKIKGMCMHHDQGALGAAQEYDSIYRQIKILKDMGCNAVRTSHNIPSKVLLKVCNELGMLVMEEFFDGWDSYKNGNTNDFSKYFSVNLESSNHVIGGSSSMTWAQFALTQAVKRDRNDPCIILWSCANELNHGTSNTNYMTIASQIDGWLAALDTTRPLTQGNNQSSIMNIDQYMDVIGGNYYPSAWQNLKTAGTLTLPFVGTEEVSAITTRGVYSYSSTYQGGKVGNDDYTLYSYDNSAVTWGNTAALSWYYTAINDWYSGEFVWTGFDYIGEPTPWYSSSAGTSTVPNSSYFGVIDTAGFPKDQYYLYRSWWQTKDTTLHLLPGTWNSSKLYMSDNYAYVNVYSNADHIELLLNGNVIARAQSTTNTTITNGFEYKTWTEEVVDSNYCNTNKIYSGTGSDLYAQFGVLYTEGTLSVKAYDSSNNEITDTVGTKSVSSGKVASKIVSKVWGEDNFTADSDSFAYIEFEAVDADGNFVNDYNGTLYINVNENGKIVGVDNGSQATTEKFQQSSVLTSDTTATIQMFNGRALAIVRTTETSADDVAITATTSDSLDVEGSTFTSRAETGDELTDEFEEVILQSDQSYVATQYDIYDMYKAQIEALEEITTQVQYVLYSVQDTGSGVDYLPSGAYIITGAATNSHATGAMTNTELSSGSDTGFQSDGTTGTPSATSDTWYFERLDNGKYYIYYFEANQKWYMNLGTTNASLTKSATPQELTVTVSSSNSTVTIGNGSQYVNYYGSGPDNFVASWSAGTSLTLYTTDGTTVTAWDKNTAVPVIDDGVYIITNLYNGTLYVVSGSLKSGTTNKINNTSGTVTDNVLDTDASNEYTFINTGDSAYSYYIKNSSGQYLNIGTSNGSVSFSDTAQALTVAVLSDGRIGIYNSGQFLDNYNNEGVFSSWTSTVESISENRKMTLYSKENATASTPEQGALYNALNEAATYTPGTYDSDSYDALLAAVGAGLSVYNNSEATSDELSAAAQAINDAIAGLTTSMKKFPARLIKYGYDPTSSTPYSLGGSDYNNQTFEAMKAAILANADLVSQIKDIMDYEGTSTAWGEGYADTALDAVAAQYAKIYSLSFAGYVVRDGTNIDGQAMMQTAWNYWDKVNTQGAEDTATEGASVQGLFSATLDENGMPTSHAAYNLSDGLSYLSGAENGITSNRTVSVNVDESNTKTITLTPLNNISVYAPDFFSANNVDGSTTGSYSKFYWDTEFPFIMTTDELGINTYVYDSSDTKYIFRAKYDDSTQTAQSELIETSDWSVNRANKGNGQGFFPFNYTLDDDASDDVLTGENAVYHYGMTFSTDFYLPSGGKYAGSTEDIVFNFSGDDDVLVYIDDVLVLDNGGIHGARSCSINFTESSVSYQYAMDVTEGAVKSTTENAVVYKYGEANDGISADNLAAINYLNEVLNDGENHTFTFFYLERGSTDSNCKISFNLQQVSSHISLVDQALVADFGLPISYDVTANNAVSQKAQENGATISYIGIADSISSAISFAKPNNLIEISETGTLSESGTYGDYTVTSAGVVTYDIKSTEFSGADSFYLCAEIANDPTYSNGTVYYAFEKVTFIPATVIYYEDDFRDGLSGGISYTDGTVPADYDNSASQYGIWGTVTDGQKAANQAADLVGDVDANVYGFDQAYENFSSFSNASAKKVTVSTKNNPNATYSGGAGSSWPKVQFTFKGTGFDLVSVTDCTTGIFTVEVYEGADTSGTRIKRHIVDTYYGYSYTRLYADANGEPTSTVTDTPFFWTKNNHCSTAKTYYGENGVITNEVYYYDVSGNGYTSTPTYYDADGNLTTDETENPAYAYAYAYGWIKDSNSSTYSLYQIPVIRVIDLDYNEYTVVITPMFSSFYGHYDEDSDGIKNYNLYVDGIRIYDPAGSKDSIGDSVIADAYKTDGEAYASYIELRDMLIGADSFGETDIQHGIIFVDGIPALDNDIEKYKNAGPNNELYLCSGQAVAFEIWATAVPSDILFSAKSAQGEATVSLTYKGQIVTKPLTTSTEMYYSFNSLLPIENKLTWTQTTVDGVAYYTSGTIVIANSAEQDAILSIGNIKWTFAVAGANGYFRIPTEPVVETLSLMATKQTLSNAYTSVSSMYTDLSISEEDVTVENTSPLPNEDFTIFVQTSDDVKSLLIKDADGNLVEPVSIEEVASEVENDGTKQWKVTLNETEEGTYIYTVAGVNEYGLQGSDSVEFTVTVENVPEEDSEETKTFLEKLEGFFSKVIDFFKKILDFFKMLFGYFE